MLAFACFNKCSKSYHWNLGNGFCLSPKEWNFFPPPFVEYLFCSRKNKEMFQTLQLHQTIYNEAPRPRQFGVFFEIELFNSRIFLESTTVSTLHSCEKCMRWFHGFFCCTLLCVFIARKPVNQGSKPKWTTSRKAKINN